MKDNQCIVFTPAFTGGFFSLMLFEDFEMVCPRRTRVGWVASGLAPGKTRQPDAETDDLEMLVQFQLQPLLSGE